jgi:cell division protein FtsL
VVLWLAIMFTCVLCAALAHVSLRLGVIRMAYAISERTREKHELEEKQRQLQVELSLLRSPERIEKLAQDRLHMERPDPSRIRVVRPGVRELAAAKVTTP